MSEIDERDLIRAAKTWKTACDLMKVDIVAPFTIHITGGDIKFIAFLPHFGSQSGMVIAPMNLPKIRANEEVRAVAHRKGLFVSFVNVNRYANFNRNDSAFKEALEDWGYFGPKSKLPSWFAGYDHSK